MATTNAGMGSVSAVAQPGPGHKSDTAAAYAAGKIHSFQTGGVEQAYVDFEGSYNGHDGIFSGFVTASAGITSSFLSATAGTNPATITILNTRNSNGWAVGAAWGRLAFRNEDVSGLGDAIRAQILAVTENTSSSLTALEFYVSDTDSLDLALTIGSNLSATFAGNLTVSGAGPHVYDGLATESYEIIDAGSAAATEQDWIEVEIGGNQGYVRVFAAK